MNAPEQDPVKRPTAPGEAEQAATAAREAPALESATVVDVEAELQAALAKASENYELYLRAVADAENTRRRAQEDIAKASKFAVEKFAQAMLPVKDSLEATLVAESATLDSLKAGVELTLKQLTAGLQSSGVTEINPAGDKFDPHRHQAISTLEGDGEANRVVNVLQKGYLLHDRVLRPALVVVSKARES
jgi:molecular chaperone GrpE